MNVLDNLAIKNIRVLAMETITNAKSGHPGIALGAAPIMYTLYSKVLKKNANDPKWFNRDRFVLAAGHASALLYTTLHVCGYDVSIEDLKNFRKIGSRTPGHPEVNVTSGVDATSGPLGQGIPTAVGFCISEEYLRNKYNKDTYLFDHFTYVLCGDGDLQEGVTNEALSLAGKLKLNKLIVLYDSNDIQLDGLVSMTNVEDTKTKVEAMGFNYVLVEDGENCDDIYHAIRTCQNSDLPSLIEIKTIIGKGSKLENTNSVHGSPLKEDEVIQMRNELGGQPFTVLDDVKELFRNVNKTDIEIYNGSKKFEEKYKEKYPELYEEIFKERKPITKEDLEMPFDSEYNKATRNCGGEIITKLSTFDTNMLGGSADLCSSTMVRGNDGDFSSYDRKGRNIRFGVREFCMGAVANGISIYGLTRCYCSGFFAFSDYMKGALRMQAISNSPVINIFTHDSLAVGEDGPTHQPVDQLTMIRAIPNMNVFRPSGKEETKEAFVLAFNDLTKPSTIVLTRQGLKETRTALNQEENLTSKGAYILMKETGSLDCILLASGSEVELACAAYDALKEEGINARVVSIPSMNLFDNQNEEYKNDVLPSNVFTLGIEMSEASHMYKYIKCGKLLNVTTFGASGKASDVLNKYGFTKENIVNIIKENINK